VLKLFCRLTLSKYTNSLVKVVAVGLCSLVLAPVQAELELVKTENTHVKAPPVTELNLIEQEYPGIILTEELIATIPQSTTDLEVIDLPVFDSSMPVMASIARDIARLQLDEWFHRLAKAPLTHPSVIAARFSEQEAISTISEAKAILYPQVSLGLSADSQRSTRDGEKVSSIQGLDTSDKIRMNPNLSIKQLLFDGGATQSRILAAESRSNAAASRRESTEIGVALRAADTLIELAKLQEQLESARDSLDEVERLRDMIRERVNAGRDSPSEMLQMNTRVFEARNQVIRLQGLRAEAGARHEETFGEPPVILAFPDVFAPIPMSVESGVDVAIRSNPDIVNSRKLVDVAIAEYEAAKQDGMPRIEAEMRINSYDTARSGLDFYDTFVGVSVTQNLFDGGRQNAVEKRSATGIERTRAQSQQTLADVEFAIKRAYSNRESLIPRYKSLQAQLDQKLKTRQAYEAQFIAGRRPLNDLITAQQQVLDAALNVVETKAELHRQHFTILALIGDLIVKT
jgi:outer membrane protein TolC